MQQLRSLLVLSAPIDRSKPQPGSCLPYHSQQCIAAPFASFGGECRDAMKDGALVLIQEVFGCGLEDLYKLWLHVAVLIGNIHHLNRLIGDKGTKLLL